MGETPYEHEPTMESMRARIHKLSDLVQSHEGSLREHGVRIQVIAEEVSDVRNHSATRDQLEALHRENILRHAAIETKVDNLKDDLVPIKNGISKVVWLVISAVILALLTLVFAGPPHIATLGK